MKSMKIEELDRKILNVLNRDTRKIARDLWRAQRGNSYNKTR